MRNLADIYPLQDSFASPSLDASKWTASGPLTVTNGLTMTVAAGATGWSFVRSLATFGAGYLVSSYGTEQSPQGPMYGRLGWYNGTTHVDYEENNAGTFYLRDNVVCCDTKTIATADNNPHLFQAARDAAGDFYAWVDGAVQEDSSQLSTAAYGVGLEVFNSNTNTTQPDSVTSIWVKVRPWIPGEPVASAVVAAPTATSTSTSTPTPTPTSTPVPPMSRTVTYTYDGIGELTSASENPGNSFAYSYDPAGNRLSTSVNNTPVMTATYNAANEVNGWTYDAAGNLTYDGFNHYTYDALGRLTWLSQGNYSPPITTYAYNGDGSLVASTHSTTPPGLCLGLSTTYTVDLAASPDQIIASAVGHPGQGCPAPVTSDYLRDGAGTLLASASNSTTTWYGLDRQGSVRQTFDNNANLLATRNYDPYGQPETSSQVGAFGYTGELESNAGEYLRARWYQPGTGTLLGVDPEVDATGQAYAYASDDPVNGSDASGACWVLSGQELENYPQTPPQTVCSADDARKLVGKVYAASVYEPAQAVVEYPGWQFATFDQAAALAIGKGARLVYGSAVVIAPSGSDCWSCDFMRAFGPALVGVGTNAVGEAGQIAYTALPVVHNVALVITAAASICAAAGIETVVLGVGCGTLALGASAVVAGTGSILYAQHRESGPEAVIDMAGFGAGWEGKLAEMGASSAKDLATITQEIAALRRADMAAAPWYRKAGHGWAVCGGKPRPSSGAVSRMAWMR
jgi:RHS repeat-associated protein